MEQFLRRELAERLPRLRAVLSPAAALVRCSCSV